MASSLLFMGHPHPKRLENLRRRLEESGAGAFLTAHPANLFYLCGYTGDSGALLVKQAGAVLFTDGRFATQARQEVREAKTVIVSGPPALAAAESLRAGGKRTACAFEDDRISVAQLAGMRKAGGRGVSWTPVRGVVETLRVRKDATEIAVIREAARLASRVMTEVAKMLRPGMRECEVAAEIDYKMRLEGASGSSFETIVASGPRSAMPHARPSERSLGRNELVVLDLGAILRGYCSDLTRTFYVGRAPREIRRWYQAVAEAQAAARSVIRAGIQACEVDRAAREVLERARLGKYFTHSTGHGVGIEVHEAPRLARDQKGILGAGSIVTVEPGVYVAGKGGIRVEDDVLVLEGGSEVLTTPPRELVEIQA